ncbi:MAG TPA: hypothetical protein VF665_16935 [Longimicrobium sp.]|uniref:hypothetical protein n=1 Tax=Longimicrobium sp. TaxID=2029185 RepID=UPI002EDA78CC
MDLARAQKLAVAGSAPAWPAAEAGRPVLLYVDRSESMRGFLDPDYPTRVDTDYRSVLDGFDARLHPSRVFGFGNGVREAGQGLGVLGSREFYADGNTQMEDVFALIRNDSALASTHVIVGDGRRGSPDAANGQYVAMRRLAEGWIASGGTLMVASSAAPFRPVKTDPSGCRDAAGEERQTCPLYAFAFVAPGDQGRVAAALGAVFQNLYAAPLPALPGGAVRFAAASRPGLSMEPAWVTSADSMPVARVRGTASTNEPLAASLVLRDTVSPLGRAALKALRGRRMIAAIAVRALSDDPRPQWRPSAVSGALMRPGRDAFSYEFLSRGAGTQRSLYRLQLHPAGEPSWLEAFDAESATDARRTYGLGRLFESFRATDPLAAPAAVRAYAVVN